MTRRASCLCLLLLSAPHLFAPRVLGHAQATAANHKEAVDIFRQLIEINTTDSWAA